MSTAKITERMEHLKESDPDKFYMLRQIIWFIKTSIEDYNPDRYEHPWYNFPSQRLDKEVMKGFLKTKMELGISLMINMFPEENMLITYWKNKCAECLSHDIVDTKGFVVYKL